MNVGDGTLREEVDAIYKGEIKKEKRQQRSGRPPVNNRIDKIVACFDVDLGARTKNKREGVV